MPGKKPEPRSIVVIIPRGEAVRNFVYSDFLPELKKQARVTLLSVVTDPSFLARYKDYVDEIVPLEYKKEHPLVLLLRHFIHEAHFRWMDTMVARNKWEVRDAETVGAKAKIKRFIEKCIILPLANRPALRFFTVIENKLTLALRRTDEFHELYRRIKPDVVFNGSHIHGDASFLPVRVAHSMDIPTAGFIFSWDNLTNRSRIFEPYDHFIVWNQRMKQQLKDLYPRLSDEDVTVTGTPQFDFHFHTKYVLTREELCRRIGIDPARKFILYTTGIDKHFPDEHLHIRAIIGILHEMEKSERPVLVVRTYVKGTSPEMKALAAESIEDVVFPEVQWEERWFTPKYEDLEIYTSYIHHAAMSINPASTVSLEFLMLDKPVMNIGFDPPGSSIPYAKRWERHILFDHYQPVAKSGATMIAYSIDDMRKMIGRGLSLPDELRGARKAFIAEMFDSTLDGRSGERIANVLLSLTERTTR